MKYFTTNIRIPEGLWKDLKMEAAQRGKRFSEIVRQRLIFSLSYKKSRKAQTRIKSLRGVWKGIDISENLIQEARQSLFPPIDKFHP